MIDFLLFTFFIVVFYFTAISIFGFLLQPFSDWQVRAGIQRIAVEQFKKDYPQLLFMEARVVKEGSRCIVMISFGEMEPPSKRYYVVYMPMEIAEELKGLTKYYPQMDR